MARRRLARAPRPTQTGWAKKTVSGRGNWVWQATEKVVRMHAHALTAADRKL